MRRKTLRLALDALEASKGFVISARRNMEYQHNASAMASLPQLADFEKRHLEAIDVLQKALVQPQQEPKFLYDEEDGLLHDPCCDDPTGCIPLYTSPPAQTQKDTVGPSGDRLSDFRVDQWWFLELDKAFKNGTSEQKQAVAVVRNLLATIQTHIQEPPTE